MPLDNSSLADIALGELFLNWSNFISLNGGPHLPWRSTLHCIMVQQGNRYSFFASRLIHIAAQGISVSTHRIITGIGGE